MRKAAFAILFTIASCGTAYAADKPVIGPAPAWVKPVALPIAPANADEAAVRVLLSDQQVAFEPGHRTAYWETRFKIQTPQGLATGNISLPWDPAIDVLTVHKLLIRRGDQIIDVLKSGQTFTVLRREKSLESAILDGVLTANIQPEGLQVGDILELAMSVSTSDPTLQGHVEQILGIWNGYAHVVAASIYSSFRKKAEAMKAYDRALALGPEAYIHLDRSLRRPAEDLTGRRADLDAALKLDPNLAEAVAAKAKLQADSGDLAGAIAAYSSALERWPDKIDLLVGRGIAYVRSGDSARAERDFAAARAKATGPVVFNVMCWSKATAGVALESALTDCNAALAKAPEMPEYLDSRGLVLLRLGRLDDAIADYDRALAKSPSMPSSLFGRALAWARKGDRAKSQSDATTASKIDPDVRAIFEGYGLKL